MLKLCIVVMSAVFVSFAWLAVTNDYIAVEFREKAGFPFA